MEKIRVLIAEDFEPIRERYVHMLEKDPDIEVVAAVENGKDAVLQTKSLHPDVILMDIEMETKDAGLRGCPKYFGRVSLHADHYFDGIRRR